MDGDFNKVNIPDWNPETTEGGAVAAPELVFAQGQANNTVNGGTVTISQTITLCQSAQTFKFQLGSDPASGTASCPITASVTRESLSARYYASKESTIATQMRVEREGLSRRNGCAIRRVQTLPFPSGWLSPSFISSPPLPCSNLHSGGPSLDLPFHLRARQHMHHHELAGEHGSRHCQDSHSLLCR